MQAGTAKSQTVAELVRRAVRGQLDAAVLSALCADSPELVSLALLATAKRIAELEGERRHGSPSPSTPSGMVPIYIKPNKSRRRRKKPGARVGHQCVRRERPVRIDERETHRLDCCPHCQGPLQRCARSRTRVIEDIPEEIKPVVTEHTIRRDYCPNCKKHALARISHRVE